MEHLPGPSSAKENVEEETDIRSLHDENCKGELTNALKYCNSLLQEKDLLTENPPEKINSVSMAMGEVIHDTIINILGERKVVTEEELILFEESDSEEMYEEFKGDEDEVYEPEEYEKPPFDYIPLEYKARTVALAEAHPKWSLATLHKRGCSRLTRKEFLKKWKKDVQKGETHYDKWFHIDTDTFDRFKEPRASSEQVTSRTIQQWAMAAAFPFMSENFTFNASKD